MTEKEFKNNYYEEIAKLLAFAKDNSHSNFYKDKYHNFKNFDINTLTYESFKKLPLLNKDEILNISVEERLFLDRSKVRRYNLTSGTTNNKKILAIPLTDFERPGDKPYSRNNIDVENKKCLILFPPMSAAFTAYLMGVDKKNGITIPGDINNLGRTALVTKELKPEIIFTTPTILDFFIKELLSIGFDTDLVKNISLGGESTSSLKLDYFKSVFPKANILFRYGSSETGGQRGYRCEYLKTKTPDMYHPAGAFIEIVNENGEVVSDGDFGEIIHTDLISPKGFPFIRYKTGDMGSTYYEECPCGNNRIIKLGGRANYDVLKFSGITLYSEQIEKSLSKFSDKIQPTFEMHVYEEEYNNKILPKLVLKLALDNNPSAITAKIIETQVTENLQLSANKNLKYFVDNGIFLPLEVIFVDIKELNSTKKSGIISHL
jgi:phenylacetate-coenzyme A ligase PaaK-like adenylate-forming protein